MAVTIAWHGSKQEALDLVDAVTHNCACEFSLAGVRLALCESHRMLVEDQRALDGLLFVRRMADRLRLQELTSVETAQSPLTAATY